MQAIRRLIEAWNSHDLEAISRFFHIEFENHQAPFAPVIGLEAYLEHCRHWFAAFSDFRISEVTLFASGDIACLESLSKGTCKDSFFGLTPSEESEVVHACDIFEFRQDLIYRERGFWDFSVATGSPAPASINRS